MFRGSFSGLRTFKLRRRCVPETLEWTQDLFVPAARSTSTVSVDGWAVSVIEVIQSHIKQVSGLSKLNSLHFRNCC